MKKPISFVLPRRAMSGGVKVTVEMADRLLARGWAVRILCRSGPDTLSFGYIRARLRGSTKTYDWIAQARSRVEYYTDLRMCSFSPGEIVVAVGTFTVPDVASLPDSVVRVRYCHGFSAHLPEETSAAWSGEMLTIAVSTSLCGRLEELSGRPVDAVVPNGIDLNEYYPESAVPNTERGGVGTVFNSNAKKDPATIIAAVRTLRGRNPSLPIYSFGAQRKPRGFFVNEYVREASVGEARRLYSKCAVWFVASRSEGFCLPLLEAMACDTAVVSTDHDTARGIVEPERNGVLVPVGNVAALASAVERLLRERSRREALVTGGRETVLRFSWEQAVTRMETFLRSL